MNRPTTGKATSAVWRAVVALWNDESGAIMLETVLVFPLQLFLTMMIIQAAFIWSAANVINYAAFQAARTAMLEIRGTEITAYAEKQARKAALVITSVLANPIRDKSQRTGGSELRTMHHRYFFPGGHPLGSKGLEVTVGFDNNLSTGVADMVIGAAVRYYYPLTVPLAGAVMGYGYSGNIVRGVRYIPMDQVVRIPKPWPY